ncbi:CHAT domain-containing protein [Scytonema sp. NUACC26]|uniref:CHAT domain-containing protein n=1 Tax=Scytonema sp. NUACC26 TaxID=3140176 RepID=UPI0034DC155F
MSSPQEQAEQLDRDAYSLYLNGDSQGALEKLNQALVIYRKIPDPSGEGRILSNIGTIYRGLSQYSQALNFFQEALAIAQEIPDRVSQGVILGNIGVVYDRWGSYFQALDFYNQALTIAQDLGNREDVSNNLNKIGLVYSYLGQYSHALELMQQALAVVREPIVQEVSERRLEGIILASIGLVYNYQDEYFQALKFYEQALAVARELGDLVGVGTNLTNIGEVYRNLGQYHQALKFLEQALLILRQARDLAGEATTLNNIGNVYSLQKQYPQALESYQQSLSISREIGDRSGEATTLNNIGGTYDKLGDRSQALISYQQALIIRRQLGDRAGVGETLNNIGLLYTYLKQHPQALESYQQALEIQRQLGDRGGEGTTLTNVGFLYEQLGNVAEAIAFHQQAIDVFESIQGNIRVEELKASFAVEQTDIYDRLINLLWTAGRFEEAFNYVERSRARAFLDQLASCRCETVEQISEKTCGRIDIRAGTDAKLLEREQQLKLEIPALRKQLIGLQSRSESNQDAIAALKKQIDEREQDYINLLTQIKIHSSEVASLVSVNVSHLAEIQKLLDADTTLVEYFVSNEHTLVFLVTTNSFKHNILSCNRKELTDKINLFRRFSSLNNAHPKSLQELYKWLIAPVQPDLTTKKLGIVPHNILHYLPFAALTDGTNYLSQEYILFGLPSASVLPFIKSKKKPKLDTILALGNPITTEPLEDLKFAQQEAETIAKLYGTQALVGKDATESALRSAMDQTNILHLASHGQYNPNKPLFSTLYLASTSQDDGRLEVHEIYGLDLTKATNLVVLSACETQEGKLSAGDEVVGMTRAFLYAGTPSVIASLWRVNDKATGILMERFYNHLRQGMAKAEALQQAQIETLSVYPHPYYWAAFVLTGDAGAA